MRVLHELRRQQRSTSRAIRVSFMGEGIGRVDGFWSIAANPGEVEKFENCAGGRKKSGDDSEA
jgi:hypothetical protein